MKIEPFDRVVYENNPLAEVICQARYSKGEEFSESLKLELRAQLHAAGYPNHSEEASIGFTQQVISAPDTSQGAAQIVFPRTTILHSISEDGAWKVSASAEFIALTCLKYTAWSDFLPRMLAIAQICQALLPSAIPTRVGLRYKDVVERESLGLEGVAWHELIQPFLLGPLVPNALAAGQMAAEEDIAGFATNALLRLEHGQAVLQSALLTSVSSLRRAFLIDADFYVEGDGVDSTLLADPSALTRELDLLHQNAGALFRRGITERLHHALKPR